MESEVPTPFLIFALGIIAGLVVAVGLDVFRHYYFRPKLQIIADRPEVGELYSCHSVVVRNNGRSSATHAQGFISIENVDPDDVVSADNLRLGKDLGFDPKKFGVESEETVYLTGGTVRRIEEEPLCWAAVDSRTAIDIYSNTARLLDVSRMIKLQEAPQIHIPSSLGWQALLVSLRPRRYSVVIRVVAQGASPAEKKFVIEYDGRDISLRPD